MTSLACTSFSGLENMIIKWFTPISNKALSYSVIFCLLYKKIHKRKAKDITESSPWHSEVDSGVPVPQLHPWSLSLGHRVSLTELKGLQALCAKQPFHDEPESRLLECTVYR